MAVNEPPVEIVLKGKSASLAKQQKLKSSKTEISQLSRDYLYSEEYRYQERYEKNFQKHFGYKSNW